MANILVGSSNIVRFYSASSFSKVRQYTVVRCTEEASFKATLEDIEDKSNVLISTIENFIASRVRGDNSNIKDKVAEAVIYFLTTIQEAATASPRSKFAVVMPLQRPALKWYQQYLPDIESAVSEGICQMKLDNVARIDCISAFSQAFEKDGVHLTKQSGKTFLSLILDLAETYFKAELVTLEDLNDHDDDDQDDEVEDGEVDTRRAGRSKVMPTEVRGLRDTNNRLSKLESEMMRKRLSDNLMFARMREEMDAAANKSKEDRVVISGIVSKQPIPVENGERIARLREIATDIFKFLIPDFNGNISFVSQGKGQGRALPMLEVRLELVESAAAIRKSYSEKNKLKQLVGDHERLFISNSVSLATRVRIDILKAIAKKISNDEEQAYVVGFISRPIMHLRKKSDRRDVKPNKSYTFVDAVENFGHLIFRSDLDSAYNRAGNAFKGQLQQNFIVLHDEKQVSWSQPDHRSVRGSRGSSDRGARGSGTPRGRGRGDGSRTHSFKRQGDNLENDGRDKQKRV